MRYFFIKTQIVLLFFLVNITTLLAQDTRVLTGNVVNEHGDKIPGVNVVEKGTNNGVVTDFNGSFSIKIHNASQLNFSFVGMQPQLKTVGDKNNMKVKLIEKQPEDKDIIVIDYKKKSASDKSSNNSSLKEVGAIKADKKRTAQQSILLDQDGYVFHTIQE